MEPCGGCCGLFTKKENTPIPLVSLHYDVTVKAFASQVTIRQTFKNQESVDLECVYGFPINDEAGIVGLTVEIDDRKLSSQFKKKQEALKEYNGALAEGDGAYLLDQSDRSDDTFVLSVGRLPPQKECVVAISYVCTLESVSEKVLRLVIPTALAPRYNPRPQDTTTGEVKPPEVYQDSVTYTATLDAKISTFDAVKAVTSPSHPISVKIEEPNQVRVTFGADQQKVDKDIVIEIEVKENPQHHVEIESLGEGHYAALYSYVPHFSDEEADNVKTEIVFVVDCSGSMQDEDKIEEAKRAMQTFLQSIPEGCYFNFYRFGSTFTQLFSRSELYGQESFAKAKVYAKNTLADMGGTEISEPLKHIFSEKPTEGYSRQLFILTDGEVTNTEEVIQLVHENAANTRVFSFGLGNSPSRSLVNGIATAGGGKAEFIKTGENLDDKVGRQLGRALQPAVLNAHVSWKGVSNIQQVPDKLPPVFRGDRQLAYALFDKTSEAGSSSVVLQINGKPLETKLDISQAAGTSSTMLSKLAARALIKDLELHKTKAEKEAERSGSQQDRAANLPESSEKPKDELQEKITDLSLKYGVMSKYVSLLAVESRDAKKNGNEIGKMELREIPVQKAGFNRPFEAYHCMPMSMMMCSAPAELIQYESVEPNLTWKSHQMGRCENMSLDDMGEVSMVSEQAAVPEAEPPKPAEEKRSPLTQILDLQLWDGSWEFSKELEKLTGCSMDKAQEIVHKKLDAHVLATVLVIAYLKEKHASEVNVWERLIVKAKKYVGKQVAQKEFQTFSEAFRQLLMHNKWSLFT